METINAFILMCSGSVALCAFTIVLGANFSRLVVYVLGEDE